MKLELVDKDKRLLSKANEKSVIDLTMDYVKFFYNHTDIRERYYSIDSAYMNAILQIEKESCKNEKQTRKVAVPILLSQGSTAVGYLTSVFLGQTPLFPVVGDKEVPKEMVQNVEAMIQDHSVKGNWVRHFIKLFINLYKFNNAGVELSYEPIYDAEAATVETLDVNAPVPLMYINKLYAPNIYNMGWDIRVIPADASTKGEFIFYQELITKMQLVDRMTRYSVEGKLYNDNAGDKVLNSVGYEKSCYWDPPKINKKLTNSVAEGYSSWMGLGNVFPINSNMQMYLWTRMYAVLLPSDHGLIDNRLNTQIYRIELVNHKYLVSIEPVNTYFKSLPIYMGVYHEDDMAIQTQSMAENLMPTQDAATDLLINRMGATKRAVSDRILYDSAVINPAHMASTSPSARIPANLLASSFPYRSVADAIFPIPFTDSTQNTINQDIQTLLSIPDYATGYNSAREGRFRKGNRTLGEYSDIMQNQDDRQAACLMLLESFIFSPIKHQLRFNLIKYQKTGQKFVSAELQRSIEISPADIAQYMDKIKIADGLHQRDQIANTDIIVAAMQFLTANPELGQQFDLVSLFINMISASGFHSIEKYRNEANSGLNQQANNLTPAINSPGNRTPAQPIQRFGS